MPHKFAFILLFIVSLSSAQDLYVATDSDKDRQGVARRKNECLRALKDCDYVFLFDDDCFPIKDGWVNFFIQSGDAHLLYLHSDLHSFILNSKKPYA